MLRATVTFEQTTRLPEDQVQNTFWFQSPDGIYGPGDYAEAAAWLNTFFRIAPVGPVAGLAAVGAYLGSTIDRTIPPVTEMHQPVISGGKITLGGPVFRESWADFLPNAASATNLPEEVAIVATFHATYGSTPERIPGGPAGPEGDTRPRARLRGRIYLGPLSVAASNQPSNEPARPHINIQNSLVGAMARMSANLGTDGLRWSVFSPTKALEAADINAGGAQVAAGWVDNAFDTQRRRGRRSTSRITFG